MRVSFFSLFVVHLSITLHQAFNIEHKMINDLLFKMKDLFEFKSNYNEIHLEILQSAFINTKIFEWCPDTKYVVKNGKNVKTQTVIYHQNYGGL